LMTTFDALQENGERPGFRRGRSPGQFADKIVSKIELI